MEKFFEALAHNTRRQIIKLLYEKVELSHSEMREFFQIDAGSLNFHLRKIKELIQTTDKGTYILSDAGRLAYHSIYLLSKQTNTRLALSGTSGFLNRDIIARRIAAFFLDAAALFIATGLFLDQKITGFLSAAITLSLDKVLYDLPSFVCEGVVAHSPVFLAAFIILSLLEGYRGQTLGKYAMNIRVLRSNGGRIGFTEAAVRNLGKVFLLPLDIALGLIFYAKKGYLRFFDYYTDTKTERVFLLKP